MQRRTILFAPLVLVGAAALGCGAPERGNSGGNGGGNGGGGSGGGGGGGKGGGGSPSSCTPGDNICDGAKVRSCDAMGKPGPVVDTCSDTCSFGRCTTGDCAAAESKQSVVGCLFYGLDTDNSVHDDTQVFGFPVGNPGTSPVAVKVQKKVMGMWVDEIASAMVMPGEINYLRIASGPAKGKDWHIEGTGIDAKAYRISAEAPIVVYQINADDENGASGSSGSTLLLPIHALGKHYFAITPPSRGLTMESFDVGKDDPFVSIVAAQNQTKVKVTVRADTVAGGGVPALTAGMTYEAMIDEGQVLQLEASGAGKDLSGTEIEAEKPVVVYSGITCGGFVSGRTMNCDHIEETMYPVTTWGKSFIVLDLRMNAHQPSKSIWVRVVGSEDGTTLMFDPPRPLPMIPPAPVTIGRGEIFKLEIPDPLTMANRAHFHLEASAPVAVEAFMGEQEGGAVTVPVDQFLDDYLVSAHPWFTGYLMVTRKTGTAVTLDGAPMPDKVFTPGGGGFEVSYVAMPRCEMSLSQCGHRIVGTKVGVTLTANGGVCNYCYAGGAGARCVNKTAGCR